MALSEIHLKQDNAISKMTSLTVITPEKLPGPWPVLYLLHGLSDNHTAWQRYTNIERYVADYPLMVVMPDGERSFYTDAVERPNSAFETLIVRDIVGYIDRTYQTIPTREGRVIAGLSMGGYGALKLALKHPEMFCAAVSHSGAVEFGRESFTGDDDRSRELRPIMGESPAGGVNDLYAVIDKIDRARLPDLRIDCGVDDFLIEHNRRFQAHLTQSGVPHEYAEHPGAHDWTYWNLHILDTLKFFCQVLGIEGFKAEGH